LNIEERPGIGSRKGGKKKKNAIPGVQGVKGLGQLLGETVPEIWGKIEGSVRKRDAGSGNPIRGREEGLVYVKKVGNQYRGGVQKVSELA